jgi:diguanylate cyclase (GGDEF)-like protein
VRSPAARTRGLSECYGEERRIVENAGLGIYAIISKWGFPKTYRGKIMLVAFLGIHAPLLGAALYLLLGSSVGLGEALRILALLVAVTLVGTAATLLALGALLAPVRLTSSALKGYLDDRTKPDLPIGFSDEVGSLMADVRYAVEHLDSTIRSLEGLSGTDHLTDLPNRREGEDRLANDIARARRGGSRLTVAVVDLDDFKTINDTHGHHAGDVCIRHVADVIGRSVREGDWLCRWGGDEFVLALWDDSVFASPEAVLGRINADLRRSPVRLPGGEELVLSISVGAHRYAGEDDLRELLAKADGAMYQAKREGRAWVLAD